MSKCLVTGGAGFIGSHVARRLVRLGYEVIVVDDLSGGRRENVPEAAKLIVLDVSVPSTVNRLFQKHKIDYVYHLAAYAAEGLSHHIRRFNYKNNMLASINILNACLMNPVKHLVFTSSIAVYGEDAAGKPFNEFTIPQPEDPYGIAKYAVEMDIKAAWNKWGPAIAPPFTIFRPHNVFGPHQNVADRYRNVVSIFFRQAMTGKPLTVFGDGKQTRAFSYIAEVANMIAEAPWTKGTICETFNVGGDYVMPINALAKKIIEITGSKSGIEYAPKRYEVTDASADHAKVRRVYGLESPSMPSSFYLERGLHETHEWLNQNRALLRLPMPKFDKIEVPYDLPEIWK